jgi:hypothetical protein
MFLASGRRRYGYRLLDISVATQDLLAASRPVPIPLPPGTLGAGMAMLTPDGRAVVTSTTQVPMRIQAPIVTARIVELSASTGRVLRVLRVVHWATGILQTPPPACDVMSLGPAGVHPLVACTGLGRLEGSRFTPLPGGSYARVPGGQVRWLLGAAW